MNIYITGDAPDKEKFLKWAQCLGKAIGNPLYHWYHLELKTYFDFHGALSAKNAEEVWGLCNKKLAEPAMSVRNIIKRSNVTLICTTDDPVDSLEWHKMIAEDDSFDVQVLPAWRPDKAMNLEKAEYGEYIAKLASTSKVEIHTFADLKKALVSRMDFFALRGCVVSDHALEYVMFEPATDEEVEQIFKKAFGNEKISRKEEMQLKTAFMTFVSGLIYGLMTTQDAEVAVNYGAAHGALAMTTPGDTTMASKKEVEALMGGAGARVQR